MAKEIVALRESLSIELPVTQEGKAPTEFRVFRFGENLTDKGTFVFDEQSAASVMAIWAARAVPLMMDYEHQSLTDPPIEAPASAKEWTPEIRNGELWATNIKWCPRAEQRIADGEYRLFSPAFRHEGGRVVRLINIALTNNPAMHGIEPLVAARSETNEPETSMAKTANVKCTGCKKELKLRLSQVEGESECEDGEEGEDCYCVACKSAALSAKVLTSVGLSEDCGEVEALSATAGLVSLRSELRTVTGKESDAEALGVVTGWKAAAEKAVELSARVAAFEKEKFDAELTAILDEAGKAGKLPRAERDELEEKARKFGAEGVAFLRMALNGRKALVSTVETPQKADGDVVSLTAAEERIAKLNCTPLADVLALKKTRLAKAIGGGR